jgi:lantibiotic modifying enzyme
MASQIRSTRSFEPAYYRPGSVVFGTQVTLDVSGLGFVEAQPLPHRQWVGINSDAMHVSWVVKPAERFPNVPTLGRIAQSPIHYLGDLVEGFEEMYRLLMSRRDSWQPTGPSRR